MSEAQVVDQPKTASNVVTSENLADFNANKLGFKEIKLSKDLYIGLLAEINYILAEKIEKTPEPQEPSVLSNLNGGSFK